MRITWTAVGRLAWKEARALMPVWIAGIAATSLAPLVAPGAYPSSHAGLMFVAFVRELVRVGFPVAALSLGALSIGHEFNDESVGLMAGLPISRRLSFLVKVAVLAVALLGLAIAGDAAVIQPVFDGSPTVNGWSEGFLVPLLCGWALAPALTLLSGSAIGGAALAGAVPVALLLIGETVGQVRYGYGSASIFMMEELGQTILWRGLLLACAVGIVWAAYAFDRFEWVPRRPPARWPSALAGAAHRDYLLLSGWRRRPLPQLLEKELRLQSVTFAVAALYGASWAIVFIVHQRWPLLGPDTGVMSILYVASLSVLAGSMVFAPERALGTRTLGLSLPISAWRLWALKVALAETIVMGMGVGLVVFLGRWDSPWSVWRGVELRAAILAALLATVISVHASSFSKSAPRAFLLAILSAVAAVEGFQVLGSPARWAVVAIFRRLSQQPEMREEMGNRISAWISSSPGESVGLLMLVVVLAILPLRFSYLNFRSDERRPLHAGRQVAWITAMSAALGFAVPIGLALLRFL